MDKPDAKTVFDRVWSQALLAVSTAEEEAGKALGKVAEVAGWSQDEVKRHVRDFADKLASQRRELEKTVDEQVKRAVTRLHVPRRDELAELAARVETVAARLDALEKS